MINSTDREYMHWLNRTGKAGCDLTLEEEKKVGQLLVPISPRENNRMKVLRQAFILDTPDEPCFDRYTNIAARYFKVPVAVISFLDLKRAWFKSRVGIEATEIHRNDAFCSYSVAEDAEDLLIVQDATLDPRFSLNPLVQGEMGSRFYAGASIVVEGEKIGSFCLVDRKARPDFTLEDGNILKEMCNLVADLIIQRRKQLFFDIENNLASLVTLAIGGLQAPLHHLTERARSLESSFLTQSAVSSLQSEIKAWKHAVRGLEKQIESGLGLVYGAAACPPLPTSTKVLTASADGYPSIEALSIDCAESIHCSVKYKHPKQVSTVPFWSALLSFSPPKLFSLMRSSKKKSQILPVTSSQSNVFDCLSPTKTVRSAEGMKGEEEEEGDVTEIVRMGKSDLNKYSDSTSYSDKCSNDS